MVGFKNGRGFFVHGTLKSAVPQEWINELSLFFARWCKFRKAKSYSYNYWVGLVKNIYGLLGHGTLKSGVSQEWIDELSWFFVCIYWCNNFQIGG